MRPSPEHPPSQGKDDIDTGLNFNNEFPGLGTKPAQLYSNSLRRCGPNLERTPQRELGCTNDLPEGSPYGTVGSPGAGPQQWAYRGSSLGPPDEPLGDEGCDYKLSYEENMRLGYTCYNLPPLGGVRVPAVANEPLNLGFSVSGRRLPVAEWRDRLEPYYQKWYDSAPLQWGFEEGTFFPYWELRSVGMPNFVVKKHCYLDPHAGQYQLCSAYPWDKRNMTHGLLHVRSVPFVLGMGALTFEANGGDTTVPEMPMSTFPIASNGEGILGVALTRLSDGSRVAVKPIRARRHWETLGWTAEELSGMRGEKFTLDIYDFRANEWGWAAVDTFVVPAAWIQIESVTPIGGPRAGGTLIEIVGKNFGSSAEGIVVFIGDKECTSLGMTKSGSLKCITPPGDGAGVTVSVVIGDYDRTLQQGPFGGHQAGHCGDESILYPFSPCTLGEASLEAGVPKRGFTYLDAPYWISTPLTLAQEDSQYLYKAAAADDDVGDELVFVAEELPSFMRFDPATQVISGTPLRADVNCRSNKWHPAIDRCREGGFHKVVLSVSDYTFVVRQEFFVHVLPNNSPLLYIDRSFHWPTLREIAIMRSSAQLARYHLETQRALSARALEPTKATVLPWTARDSASAALRTILSNLLQETRVHPAESRQLIAAVRASGLTTGLADLVAAIEASMRAQELRTVYSRTAQPAILGGDQEGWMEQLQAFLGASVRGTDVLWEPAGGGDPWTAWSPHQSKPQVYSGYRYGGFYPTAPGPGLALSARRVNDNELVISIPTSCHSGLPRHPRVVSCDFIGYFAVHKLHLRLAPGGLRVAELVLDPPDFPHVDLVSHALESQDLFGLVEAISRRAASYAKRWEEFDKLQARYEPIWQPSSSSLSIITNVATNLSVTIDIPHDWPWPAPGELKTAPIRVLAADGIPYHRREGIAAISAELAAEAARAGGDNQGSLGAQLAALEEKLFVYAHRCRNDCEGHGDCDMSVFPPVCRCHEGYLNDDCSWVRCPNDCSGRGACDVMQICNHDPETGETDCVGGTGKCSCEEPFFGADCSLQPCAKNYLVNENNIDASLGADHYRSLYESMGWKVADVRVSANNGDPPPKGSIPGDEFSIAASAKGVVYVVFAASEDAMAARAMDPFYRDATPSRGIAERARDFPQELRNMEQRERHLLALFGASQVECTGHGACDYGAGDCYCAARYFGKACEYTYCAKDCAGHGRCDFVTGQCECEENYIPDQFLGCKLRRLYLASTTCDDDAMDRRVDASGRRITPLHLSCMLGVPLGHKAVSEHCPEANLLTGDEGDCYTKFPMYASQSANSHTANAGYTSTSTITANPVCSDCSGYDARNISQLHLYQEEPCRSVFGERFVECIQGRTASDVVRGLGMLPSSDPARPTQITFNLTTMRRKDMVFTRFRARPGIVRKFYHAVEDGGCGACTDENPMCGASFEALRDGELVYSAVVASNSTVEIDIRNATTLTLRTGTVSPTYWRLGGGLSYGGGEPPALATEPVQANFCDGAAWVDAVLV